MQKIHRIDKKENIWNDLKDKSAAGADFWYSRNEGMGCWDISSEFDARNDKRNKLYKLSASFGPAKLIQKDDGKVYPKVSIRSILKKF